MHTNHHKQVVHFDRLKLCPSDTPAEQFSRSPTEQSTSTHSSVPFGTYFKLINDDMP